MKKTIILSFGLLPIMLFAQDLNLTNGKWEFDKTDSDVANLIIITGQSNANGVALYGGLPSRLNGDLPAKTLRIGGFEVLNNASNDNGIRADSNVVFGCDLELAYRYFEATKDTLYIIKYGVAGARLVYFNDGNMQFSPSQSGEYYDSLLTYIDSAIYYIENIENKTVNFLGMVWIQGESDACDDVYPYVNYYGTEQYNLFNGVRNHIGRSEMPIYDFVPDQVSPACDSGKVEVVTAKDSVASVMTNVYTIDGDRREFILRDDSVHVNSAGMVKLGKRLANMILGGSKQFEVDQDNILKNYNTRGYIEISGGIKLKNDTTVTAVVGRIIYQASDSTFYGCRSTTANKKWYPLN